MHPREEALQKLCRDYEFHNECSTMIDSNNRSIKADGLVYCKNGLSFPQAASKMEKGTAWAITPNHPTAVPRLIRIMVRSYGPGWTI